MTEPGLQTHSHIMKSIPYNSMGCFIMYGLIFFAILTVLAVVGIGLIFIAAVFRASVPDKKKKYTIVCIMDSSDEYSRLRLGRIADAVNVLGLRDHFVVVAVAESSEEESQLSVSFPDRELIIVCTEENFFEKISN